MATTPTMTTKDTQFMMPTRELLGGSKSYFIGLKLIFCSKFWLREMQKIILHRVSFNNMSRDKTKHGICLTRGCLF